MRCFGRLHLLTKIYLCHYCRIRCICIILMLNVTRRVLCSFVYEIRIMKNLFHILGLNSYCSSWHTSPVDDQCLQLGHISSFLWPCPVFVSIRCIFYSLVFARIASLNMHPYLTCKTSLIKPRPICPSLRSLDMYAPIVIISVQGRHQDRNNPGNNTVHYRFCQILLLLPCLTSHTNVTAVVAF